MNCNDIHNLCDAYLDHELSDTQKRALEAHLESCPACQHYVQQAQTIRDALTTLKAPAMRPAFAEQAFDKARQQNATVAKTKRLTGTGLALAASLALAGIVGVFMHRPDATVSEPAAIYISMQKVKDISLVFNAKEDLDKVSISIELSDNLALDGYDGKRTVSWNTPLQKGKNVLSLPIIATQSGNGTLIARLRLGNQDKVFRIRVNAQQNGSTQIKPISPHTPV
ncbi:hypothetical protein MNBD_GAMMA24-683 [hydrothermal vent metagenome]|uniref:Putative zinc-finger domain-containing protein n=1 Tax=hydrothermal vent metagenome TaxID=652676 RepID=A0A3B1BGW1_9ZZZZ